MFTIYFFALIGVTVIILAVMLDSILAVSRPAKWTLHKPILMSVQTDERRGQDVSFIGTERRGAADAAVATEQEIAQAA